MFKWSFIKSRLFQRHPSEVGDPSVATAVGQFATTPNGFQNIGVICAIRVDRQRQPLACRFTIDLELSDKGHTLK
jgi:hypothetical protein